MVEQNSGRNSKEKVREFEEVISILQGQVNALRDLLILSGVSPDKVQTVLTKAAISAVASQESTPQGGVEDVDKFLDEIEVEIGVVPTSALGVTENQLQESGGLTSSADEPKSTAKEPRRGIFAGLARRALGPREKEEIVFHGASTETPAVRQSSVLRTTVSQPTQMPIEPPRIDHEALLEGGILSGNPILAESKPPQQAPIVSEAAEMPPTLQPLTADQFLSVFGWTSETLNGAFVSLLSKSGFLTNITRATERGTVFNPAGERRYILPMLKLAKDSQDTNAGSTAEILEVIQDYVTKFKSVT